MKPGILRIAIAFLPLASALAAAPMIDIPAGAFRMCGDSGPADERHPVVEVSWCPSAEVVQRECAAPVRGPQHYSGASFD